MKKVVIKGPIYSQSGYGNHCRLVYEAIKRNQEYDIYVLPTPWGASSWLWENSDWRKEVDMLIGKTAAYLQQPNCFFDIGYNVVVPNEFERLATYTFGVTAGIETDKCHPEWIQKINETVDKVIVPSTFAKKVLQETVVNAQDQFGNSLKLKINKPIEVGPFIVKQTEQVDLNLDLKTDFNFLCVAQIGPRKNINSTMGSFFKAFHDNANVGLIMKVSFKNNCVRDRLYVQKEISDFKKLNFPNAKCKLYVLHGYMTDNEMHSLYSHKKVKALISFSHGEGFGLPLFEAAYSGLPIISHNFGGQTDFLYYEEKGKKEAGYSRVDYDLDNVKPEAVTPSIITPDMKWAYPREISCIKKMQEMYKDHGRHVGMAKKLKKYVHDNFGEDKLDIYNNRKYEQIVIDDVTFED